MSTGESPSFPELPPRQTADAPAPVSGGAYNPALDWRRTPTILLRRPATPRRRLPLRWVLPALLVVVAAGTIVEATTRLGGHAKVTEVLQSPAPPVVSTQTTPAVAPTTALTATPRQSKPALLGPASTTAPQTPKPARRTETVPVSRPDLPLTAPVRPSAPVVPAKPRSAPTVVPQQTAPAGPAPPVTTVTTTAPPAAPAVEGVTPMPYGGYVLADGFFRVSGHGRQVLDFALRSHCGGSVILPPMQVDPTGAFTFDGHPPRTPSGTVVQITGRFVSPREARGTWKVSRDVCRGEPVSFVAQLS